MSDSSNSVDSFCESNTDLESNLVESFNRLALELNLEENVATEQSSSSSKINNFVLKSKMSLPILDIKNLSIIPNFDGNPNKLHRFISASESILTHYYDIQNTNNFQNILLLNGILNKLEGRAEEVIAINGANSWESIKKTLLQNFGDQRDENCLNQDLVNLRQKPNETPQQFHEKIIHLLNTICNYIDLHCDADERLYKRNFFTKQALKTFLAGLREPLGPIIRAMRPQSLVEALQFISEEDNIKYFQKSYNSAPVIKKTIFQNYPQTQRFTPKQYVQPSTSNQFPRGPINVQRHPNPPMQKFPTHSQVFGKPQNVWKPNPNNRPPQTRPTPMSTSTRNTMPHFKNSPNYFQNYNQKPTFISEELFNTELDEAEQSEDQDVYFSAQQFEEPSNETSNYYTGDEFQNQNFQELQNLPEET